MRRFILGFLFFICSSAMCSGQWLNKFGVDVEGGIIRTLYSYDGFGLGVFYQLPYVKLRLSHYRNLVSHGEDFYGFWDFRNPSERQVGFEHATSRHLDKFKFTSLTVESEFRIGDFKLIAEAGAAYQNRSGRKSYYVFRDALEFNSIGPSTDMVFTWSLGYRFKKATFYYQRQIKTFTKIGLRFSFEKENLKKWNKSYIIIRDKKFKKNNSFLYAYFRTRYEVPLSKRMKSTGTKIDVGLDVKLKEYFHLFGMMTLANFGHGADKAEPAYIASTLTFGSSTDAAVVNSRKIGSVSNIHLGIQRAHPISSFVKLEYGLGVAYFHFEGSKFSWNLSGTDTSKFTKNVFGLVLKSQIRIGPFGNGLELQIPFQNMPPSISYHWSIGLNFRKKVGERLKPINVYDKTPGWN